MYLIYLILILLVLLILFKIYVKVTYKFWANQPVFHYYNLYYWINPKGVINIELPTTNKYCNFFNITTKDFSDYDKNTLKEIITFIRTYYHRSKGANYLPTLSDFSSYFVGNNDKTFISTYYESTTIIDKLSYKADKELIGIMTTRPVNITLKGLDTFKAYYVDYLCVHTHYRKKGIAPQIIQTHEYVQRHKNNKIQVSLFKREGNLTGIVALTIYKTYQFYIDNITEEVLPHASMQLIEINKLNIRLLTSFISNQTKFECFVLPDLSNLINLVINETFKIYGIIENDRLIAVYFFKNSHMSYDIRTEEEKEKKLIEVKAIEYFAAINNCHHNEIFIKGFTVALHKYSKKIKAKLVTIENIGDNNIIINHIFLLNIIPRLVSPTAYFYYNYAKLPIMPDKAFIIC